jgi:hypothetical protein
MAVTAKFKSVDREVQLITDELLSPKARSQQFAGLAQQQLDQADSTNRQVLGRIPRSKTWVDGRQDAPLESVKPAGGIIVREYDLVIDALIFISEELKRESPIGKADKRPGHPGLYKASHTLFADGTEVEIGTGIPEASQYVFLSAVPYARKVERWFVVYENTAAKAAARFGNIAKVYFSWRAPYDGALVGGAKGNRSGGRYPAIIVSMGR